ncbi:MAG: hypothetical protein NT067_03240 [Candidatus Diapherotrites archaeon]|nr:hypothetical protein [Candidatus Diapherotrites archaeon]
MKGSFCIKAKEENAITEKGARAFIMERLLNSPFSKGSVVNVDSKTVQVNVEGDEKQIRDFVKKLEKDLVSKFSNPSISFTLFQEDSSLEIPDLMRSSQALMVGQLQKGINVQLDILSTLKQLPKELAGALKE